MKIVNKAKAAVFVGANKPFEIREYTVTEPQKGYARLSLIASGVCGTDIHIHNGKLGTGRTQIIGHEFVGKIDAMDDAEGKACGLKQGDNVISFIACPCQNCPLCLSGDDANCVNMKVTNGEDPDLAPHFYGGYAQYSYAPIKNLIKIPAQVDPQMAAVFACPGPTAIHAFGLAAKAGCDIKRIQTALIQGTGPVGTFAVAYLATLGVKNVIVVSANLNKEKEELLRKLGATHFFALADRGEQEIISEIKDISSGFGAELAFEGSGNPQAISLGMNALRNRGVYLVPGQYSNSGGIMIQPQMITFKALQILGSSQYSHSDVEDYVAFLEANPQLHDSIRALATCYSVEQVNKAFEDAKARKNIKTILVK